MEQGHLKGRMEIRDFQPASKRHVCLIGASAELNVKLSANENQLMSLQMMLSHRSFMDFIDVLGLIVQYRI